MDEEGDEAELESRRKKREEDLRRKEEENETEREMKIEREKANRERLRLPGGGTGTGLSGFLTKNHRLTQKYTAYPKGVCKMVIPKEDRGKKRELQTIVAFQVDLENLKSGNFMISLFLLNEREFENYNL